MLNLKRTAAAMLALTSSLAVAGPMGAVCVPADVTVPCERTAWDFGIQALYVQQAFNDEGGNYLGRYSYPSNNTTYNTFVDNDIRWGWGFKLEGSYHFGTGNDVNINWYHTSDNSRTRNFPNNFFNNQNLQFTNEELSITTKPRWDAVNLEFGQYVDYSPSVKVRYHAGLQYANLKYALGSTASASEGSPFQGVFKYSSESKSKLIGPRIGGDFGYVVGKGWGVYAKGAMAMLVGKNKINGYFSAENTSTSFFDTTITSSGSRQAIVPEMDGKLGITYSFPVSQGILTADAGYLWVNYFNSTSVNFFGNAPDDSDFGVRGPYVGFKWVGSVA